MNKKKIILTAAAAGITILGLFAIAFFYNFENSFIPLQFLVKEVTGSPNIGKKDSKDKEENYISYKFNTYDYMADIINSLNAAECASRDNLNAEQQGYYNGRYSPEEIASLHQQNIEYLEIVQRYRGLIANHEYNSLENLYNHLQKDLKEVKERYIQSEKVMGEYGIVEPCVNREGPLGVNEFLDYAGGNIIIFHGYFGLFVYDIEEENMLASLSLATYECQAVQGSDCCNILVSKDGSSIYICPYEDSKPKKYMYLYKWKEQKLIKMSYSLKGIDAFDNYVMEGHAGVEVIRDGKTQVGYLEGADETIGSLQYVEGDRKVLIFKNE